LRRCGGSRAFGCCIFGDAASEVEKSKVYSVWNVMRLRTLVYVEVKNGQ